MSPLAELSAEVVGLSTGTPRLCIELPDIELPDIELPDIELSDIYELLYIELPI